ncbi:MAG: RHS repeat protein, partial [Dehalococcoidia bacterium]|nr:RHS repeat protein [Dehalococcoidia bacterium]
DRKTVFAYDPAGNLVLLGDPAGRETRFDYVPGGALASITDCRGNTMSMQWDVAGRPARVINARGGETSFVHDAEGHVVAKSYDGMELATYEYDAAGNLQRMTDPTGVIVHTCDARGLPSSTVHPDGTEIQYTHDPNGNVSSITYPGGLTVTYEYDERNRVRHVRFGAAAVGLLYDRAGHLTAETRSNGCATAYRYDEGMFFREIAHARGQDSLAKIEQRRNAFGDIVEEAVSGMYRSYLLDEQTSVSHNELDQIIERDGRRYQYDEDGNLLAISDGSMSAEYDQENRLLSIEIHGTKTLYDYNGVGDRVAITQGDERLHLHHDVFGRLLFETDPSRRIRNRYVYAANRLVAVVNDRDEIFFYHADSRGSAILLTDEAGEVAVSYAYSPLGSVTVDARREVRNPFTYVGTYGVTDEGGGLYFMKNRFYDSATGGFMQRDPLWFAAGTNLYAYAKGNPLSYVDPSGLAAINDMSMMLGLSNFMGGLVGGMVAIVGGGLILGGSVIAGPGLLLGGGLYAASRLAVGFRQVDAAMRGEAVCNENSGYSIARSSFLGGIPFVKSVTYAVELNGKGVAWEVGKLLMGDYGAVLDAAEDVTDLNLIPEECVPAISGGTVTIP